MDSAKDLLNLALDGLMVFAPIVGYVPQYMDIQKSRNPRGFSTLVCFILLVSNVVRIFYWVGERFAISLLLQSFLMIAAQLMLLNLCVTLRRKNGLAGRSGSLMDVQSFWNWPYFYSFLQFIGALAGVMSVLTLLFVRQRWFVEITGIAALGLEAMLAVPQAYANWKNQSAEGLNLILIATWFLGDTFKTIIFITSGAPFQFLACGLFQLFIDCVILAQLFIYKGDSASSTQRQR